MWLSVEFSWFPFLPFFPCKLGRSVYSKYCHLVDKAMPAPHRRNYRYQWTYSVPCFLIENLLTDNPVLCTWSWNHWPWLWGMKVGPFSAFQSSKTSSFSFWVSALSRLILKESSKWSQTFLLEVLEPKAKMFNFSCDRLVQYRNIAIFLKLIGTLPSWAQGTFSLLHCTMKAESRKLLHRLLRMTRWCGCERYLTDLQIFLRFSTSLNDRDRGGAMKTNTYDDKVHGRGWGFDESERKKHDKKKFGVP